MKEIMFQRFNNGACKGNVNHIRRKKKKINK